MEKSENEKAQAGEHKVFTFAVPPKAVRKLRAFNENNKLIHHIHTNVLHVGFVWSYNM
jgi:hypothetical protein